MRAREFVRETAVGHILTPRFEIVVDDHALERARERGVDPRAVDYIIRTQLPKVSRKLDQIEVNQKFWVYDWSRELALGLRRLSSTEPRFILKTVWPGRPARTPEAEQIISINESIGADEFNIEYSITEQGIEESANPADTLYFFDVARGGRSFDHLDLRIMGLKKSQKGRWYYQPGRDSTDLLTNATLKHLEKTLNVPARAWKRPVAESRIIDPERVDVYYRPVPGSRGRRVVARNIPTSTLEPLLQKLSEKYAVPVESFEWTPTEPITEAFDQPYAVQWTKQNGDWHATADLDDGGELIVLFMAQGDNQWMVEFERDENMEITGEGDAPRVFATVLTAMRQFIAKRKPAMLNFSAEKEDDPTGSRTRLYDRMVQRYISGTGYDLTRQDYPGGATYMLTKQAQGVAEDAQLPGDFKLMGQNLFLKNLARNLKQRYPNATVKLLNDRVTAYHNEGDDEALTVMGTEVMDSGYIGVGLDDAFTESFQGVLVPTIKQTTEQLLAANPGMKPALFLSADNWNPDAWTHIATKLGYRLVADDEELAEGANWDDEEDPLVEALESWMMMDYGSQTIKTILSSPEAESYKQPPNVQWLYRAIVPRDREINSIKAQGPVVAFATEMAGAITFIQSLETSDDWVIIRKPFNPADFLLDFTAMYEDIVEPDHMSRYEVEHEVWMKAVPAYTKANKQEIVYTSKEHYGDDDWRKKNSEPKVAGPAALDLATIKKNPEQAYLYALGTINGRWPEAESEIMKKPAVALKYAKNIIHGRWPEAESEIMKDPQAARKYSQLFNLDTPAQDVAENFADGKGPGRPGDSVRHGIPKKATMAELEKASHAKGRKGQLARWQLNMRKGHKK